MGQILAGAYAVSNIGPKELQRRALRECAGKRSKPSLTVGAPKPAPKPSGARPKRSALTMQQIGGRARAKALTPERRSEIAKCAAAARWRKKP
jgi:hypothetical protein